jgi:hypothetical protein
MAWVLVRLGLPNSAVIVALALVPIISLAFDDGERSGMPSKVAQAVISDGSPTLTE